MESHKNIEDVLIVDDDDSLRNLLKTVCEIEGCKVDTAENGRIGLDLARNKTYDLIFSDYDMPVMGGFEFRQALVNNGYPAKFVYMSGGEIPFDVRQLQKVDGYLNKPFGIDEIKKYIVPERVDDEKIIY